MHATFLNLYNYNYIYKHNLQILHSKNLKLLVESQQKKGL